VAVPTDGGTIEAFSQCSTFAPVGSLVGFCIFAKGSYGQIQFGRQTVPVTSAFTLQGGFTRNEETETEAFTAALDSETLSEAPQRVPGGLRGLITTAMLPQSLKEAYRMVLATGSTNVTATAVLAAPASTIAIDTSHIVNEEGDGLTLPIKIHLENPFLGSECYIGSKFTPIVWSLTSGETSPPTPDRPIRGKLGDLEAKSEGPLGFYEISDDVEVNNSFAVPGASGCGGSSSVIDRMIDAKIGLPSPAGHNSVVLGMTVELAAAQSLLEQSPQAKNTAETDTGGLPAGDKDMSDVGPAG
jgi:hypothetical protein